MPPVYQIPHTDPKKHSKLEKYILYIFLVAIFVAIVAASYCFLFKKINLDLGGSRVACPAIAIFCPDGSYVTASGPNCEVPACPN